MEILMVTVGKEVHHGKKAKNDETRIKHMKMKTLCGRINVQIYVEIRFDWVCRWFFWLAKKATDDYALGIIY